MAETTIAQPETRGAEFGSALTGAGWDREAPDTPVSVSFDEILVRHNREIYRYALHLTRNGADADDLYQETLLKAFRGFDRLDSSANYRAWLYRIATNTFLSDRRKLGRIRPIDEITAEAIEAPVVDHATQLDARDLLQEVGLFIEALPAKQRLGLVMRKHQELDYAEIGLALKCSEAAARANVHEALRKLRDCFGDRL
ncbi:MAG: RNA polymerase sigma factor [Chloroflexota bacterium]|nr:RNA polymerase sigma factor [Chloroflexota bacterium]